MSGLTRADLTTIATRTGRKVVAAWSDRNAGAMGTVVGVVMHHTGSAQNTATVAPTLGIVREGRSDLQNALSAYYIDKAGTIYLITEKIAWHAGQGFYRGVTDANGHFLGIEAESDGITWTQATIDAYAHLVAEICRYLGADVNTWAIRHATWATPPGRKTDFAGMSESGFMARVNAILHSAPTPAPAPVPARKGLFMYLTEAEERTILAAAQESRFGVGGDHSAGRNALWLIGFRNDVAQALAALAAGKTVDATAVAAALKPALVAAVQAGMSAGAGASAAQIADELAKRLTT